MDKRRGREHLAGRAIDYIDVAVAFRADEYFSRLPFDRQIEQHVFIDAVVVVEIVRRELIRPYRLAGVGLARENRRAPFVVAGPLLGVPRPGVAGAIVDEIELRIVGDPAPYRAAADLPRLRRPARNAQILALFGFIKGLEAGSDEDILVRAGAVGAPDNFAAG